MADCFVPSWINIFKQLVILTNLNKFCTTNCRQSVADEISRLCLHPSFFASKNSNTTSLVDAKIEITDEIQAFRMAFCMFDRSQGWNRPGTGILHKRFCDFASGGWDVQERTRKEGTGRNGTDVKKSREP